MDDIDEEYPFSFLNTPTSLLILASTEVALTLWRHKFTNTYQSRKMASSSFLNQEFSCREILVPTLTFHRIEVKIDEKIASIRRELKKWVDFHSEQALFDGDFRIAFGKCFKHFVVDFSGSIGFKSTAINILNSGEFNNVENYKIATTFCLEDQVRRFWPVVRNYARVNVDFEDDECNLSYWNGCMKSGGNLKNDTLWVIKRMNINAPNWKDDGTAFEYFCRILPGHVRVWQIISLLERGYVQTAIRSLPSLRRVLAEEVFKQKAPTIFAILLKNGHHFRYVYQLWTLMGHSLFQNEQIFVKVVRELWEMTFIPGGEHGPGMNYSRCDQINHLLLEIWSNTPDKLKSDISNNHVGDFFQRLVTKTWKFSCHYGHDMTFLLDLLSRSQNVANKEQLWQKHWRGLILLAKPSCFKQLMTSCVPANDDDDSVEFFKNNLKIFRKLFRTLIKEGFYSDLRDYLKYFSNDAKQVQVLSRKVLGSNLDVILFQNDDKFAKFDWFVGEVYSNVQKEVDEFKSRMISTAECLKLLLESARSSEFSRIIGRFVTTEEKLNSVKRKLLEHCRNYPINRKFKCETFYTNQWREFLDWCASDADEISVLKQSLDLDQIFSTHLNDFFELPFKWRDVLKSLDQFFEWYFTSEQDWRNFKLGKIRNYRQIDILRFVMESSDPTDGRFDLYYLLKWGFDGDIDDLRGFCENCHLGFFAKS